MPKTRNCSRKDNPQSAEYSDSQSLGQASEHDGLRILARLIAHRHIQNHKNDSPDPVSGIK